MRLAPVQLGNADPDAWRGREQRGERAEVDPETYNGGSRKCVWAMMLISILLILHVQRDRYIEALRWHGGIADHGPPLPWEVQPMILPNDTYEASFLAPSLRRASSFVKLSSSVLGVNGMASTVFTNSTRSASDQSVTLVVGSGTLPICKEAKEPCLVAVQRGEAEAAGSGMVCHHFSAGAALGALQPLGKDLCFRSKHVYAALATALNKSEVVLAWDPNRNDGSRPYSCLARVTFPQMQRLTTLAVDLVASVIYDRVTDSIITLGFSGSQTIIADQYQASTLKPQLRYSIPISVTWLLHAPKMSDGFLLFLGSETPFIGSIFAVDLRRQMIYQQDPPTGGPNQRPRRWVLPYNKFVERLPDNPAASKQSQDGPCSTL
ncbi:Uncharacterized protein SCF082_LOCUS19059 [Durusdinium trenchii]|uniref:Peptidase A1 domain-containing protein n=1 Tax=Durusdinium trenchii TaxID=1381693 RepID=A0ABP0KVP1_9DINO